MGKPEFQAAEIGPVNKLLERTPLPPSKRKAFLAARLLLLQHLNLVVRETVLPLISLSSLRATAHGRALSEVRGLVFWRSKVSMWEAALRSTQESDSRKQELVLFRRRAKQLLERGRVDYEGKRSLLAQAQAAMSKWSHGGKDMIHLLRTQRQAFDAVFAGEGGEDAGGLFREAIDSLAAEAETRPVPLTVPNPNKDNKVGEHHDRRLWAPLASEDPGGSRKPFPAQRRLLRFLGQIMGYTMRCRDGVLPLNLAGLAWKQLVGETVTLQDLVDSDQLVVQNMEEFRDLAARGHSRESYEYQFDDQCFAYSDCAGDTVAVVPGGREKRVTFDEGPAYADAVLRYRMHESDSAAAEVRRGLATVVPVDVLNLWTWQDMERMVAGDPNPSIERLKAKTRYDSGLSAESPEVKIMWDSLEAFSGADRSLFLLFVWGRSRLPASDTGWDPSQFRVTSKSCSGDPNENFPHAHTCFFQIDLPRWTDPVKAREKLLFAITYCRSVDADGGGTSQRAMDLGTGETDDDEE
jgi:hypothetical protein